ncbi:hypothetical protein M2262_001454 [Pseudomonas sp. BIGb0408]|uniref:Inhibitor of vertebrate lysozyme (Ivy) n=2 Tax=Pseudomonadales TaxID=72274 RepID=A0A7Y9XMC5_9GAMM|nr:MULTISPECIES: hypothetical protein [Pseudomonas]MCW2291404.1 hypothetical protein [Pseudomonas sp. BIGb0408]NYH74025.1 hypothetical protein [Pseudomonas flavescens]
MQLIKAGMLVLAALLGAAAQAAERQVYLVATVHLDGSNQAQSIFLHEPKITELQGCLDAVRKGQRERDWQQYHHIFRRDAFKGFTGHMRYRCAYSDLQISGWYDGPRYNQPYLITVDDDSVLGVTRAPSQAQCSTQLRALPAKKQAQSFCAMGNQSVTSR